MHTTSCHEPICDIEDGGERLRERVACGARIQPIGDQDSQNERDRECWQQPQSTAHVEAPEGDPPGPVVLTQQDGCDEKSAEYEKDVNPHPPAREGLRPGV